MTDPNLKVADAEAFCRGLASTVNLGLVAYSPTIARVVEYAETGSEDALARLHEVGRHLGLELLGYVRGYDLLRPGWNDVQHDPGSVVELAAVVGESLAILLAITTTDHARRVPMATIERIQALYEPTGRAWIARYVSNTAVLTFPDDRR